VAPAFSVVYGVTLLDERFTVATAAGLVLIVGGSWIAAEGRLPWRRRMELPAEAVVPAREPA
jgi:drug/metabolite transporter (DMT)-like permease